MSAGNGAGRVFNFSAGPATLPEAVLERVRDEALDWSGNGMSVMEASHRDAPFMALARDSEARLRRLLDVPGSHRVIFMHGPARLHFSAVPLNLTAEGARVDYVDSGLWSTMAVEEAGRYCDVNVAASSKDARYAFVPPEESWRRSEGAAYLHYTPNETIGGLEFHWEPDPAPAPLVADMSSNILSRPVDVSRFGLIYAGAQKNLGIAGLTVVIVREDLLGRARPSTPDMLNYTRHAENDSLAATAPTFPWYVCSLVLEWIEAHGGARGMAERNRRKADKLYACIEGSNFYASPIEPAGRSLMNVPFTLPDPALDVAFLEQAHEAGLYGLKGHRFVGGMRASLYNAMPEAGVDALVGFMEDFVARHG